ncbi:MAG: PLD nuclease N-terminal domain-containing protein [Nocardioidaceae bacterium]
MRFLPGILLVVLAIYCWIELAQSDPRDVRQAPRALWALMILLPLVGPIGWLVYGRPNGDEAPPVSVRQRKRPVAPDDDPDFLRNIRFDPPGDP